MDEQTSRRGLIYGFGAYGLWGLIPLYFRLLHGVPPLEVLAHRVVWSFVLMAALVTVVRRWNDVRRALASRQVAGTLLLTTLLIGVNWLVYIYAVSTGQVLQSSLGYFVTPLVNVLLGLVFLGERLRGAQWAAVGLAAIGVLNLVLTAGQVPWIALSLAVSFGFYGLLRKTVAVDGLTGLFVETLVLVPLSVGFLGFLGASGQGAFGTEADARRISALLASSGVVTAVPLLLFTGAARRLRMTTLGVLQYLAPTIQFLLAVFAFGESFARPQLVSFGCIWAAIAVYTAASLRPRRVSIGRPAEIPAARPAPCLACDE